MSQNFHLVDGYVFKGFTTKKTFFGLKSNPNARVIELKRDQKKLFVNAVTKAIEFIMIKRSKLYEISPVVILKYT